MWKPLPFPLSFWPGEDSFHKTSCWIDCFWLIAAAWFLIFFWRKGRTVKSLIASKQTQVKVRPTHAGGHDMVIHQPHQPGFHRSSLWLGYYSTDVRQTLHCMMQGCPTPVKCARCESSKWGSVLPVKRGRLIILQQLIPLIGCLESLSEWLFMGDQWTQQRSKDKNHARCSGSEGEMGEILAGYLRMFFRKRVILTSPTAT